MNLTLIVYVAVGGALGSVARYAVTYGTQSRLATTFPLGTLVVNVTGSILLGFVTRYAVDSVALSNEMRLLLTVGFCGAYTTFSTYSYETVRLLQDGAWMRAGAYAILSFVLALAGLLGGSALARAIFAARSGI